MFKERTNAGLGAGVLLGGVFALVGLLSTSSPVQWGMIYGSLGLGFGFVLGWLLGPRAIEALGDMDWLDWLHK